MYVAPIHRISGSASGLYTIFLWLTNHAMTTQTINIKPKANIIRLLMSPKILFKKVDLFVLWK